MARPKNVIRSIEKSISLPENLVARVDLELFSDLEGRVPFGKWSELVTELLESWVRERMEATGPLAVEEEAAQRTDCNC